MFDAQGILPQTLTRDLLLKLQAQTLASRGSEDLGAQHDGPSCRTGLRGAAAILLTHPGQRSWPRCPEHLALTPCSVFQSFYNHSLRAGLENTFLNHQICIHPVWANSSEARHTHRIHSVNRAAGLSSVPTSLHLTQLLALSVEKSAFYFKCR